jgi:transposase
MVAALEIRKDRTPTVLRKLAKAEADTRVARRMLAIANALDGMSREEAARSAGMDRQTLRDWVLRYKSMRSTASPTAGAMVGRPRSTRKSKPS